MLNSQRVTLSIFARKNASIQQTWVIIFCWNSIWKKNGGSKDGTILVPHNSYGNFGTHVHIHIVLLASHISPGWSVPKFQPQIWKTLEKMRELRNIQNGNMVISYDMICFFWVISNGFQKMFWTSNLQNAYRFGFFSMVAVGIFQRLPQPLTNESSNRDPRFADPPRIYHGHGHGSVAGGCEYGVWPVTWSRNVIPI